MARFCPLFSSSSGNSMYIGGRSSGILVDAGMSAKQLHDGLWNIGVSLEGIRGIFITHEHIDHIKGLKVFTKKCRVPVYASAGTMEYLTGNDQIDPGCETVVLENGQAVEAGDMLVCMFETPHDSAQSCGFSIHTSDGRVAAVATDLGHVTSIVQDAISGCDLVALESNHDVSMLKTGPYPYYLKKRILSDYGHLSNDACAEEVLRLVRQKNMRFVLSHLSCQNNLPLLALETTRQRLRQEGLADGVDYELHVAAKVNASPAILF